MEKADRAVQKKMEERVGCEDNSRVRPDANLQYFSYRIFPPFLRHKSG